MALALQSIQKRLPRIIGPPLAGFVLDTLGREETVPEEGRILGMRILVAVALALGGISLLVQLLWMPKREKPPAEPVDPEAAASPSTPAVRPFHPTLQRLLLAEIFTRWCDWLVRPFVVLYVVFVH